MLLTSTSEVYGDPEVHPQKETYWGHVNPIGKDGHTYTSNCFYVFTLLVSTIASCAHQHVRNMSFLHHILYTRHMLLHTASSRTKALDM
jgi:hypothetical protein